MTTAALTYSPRLSTRVWHQPADVLSDNPLPTLGEVLWNDDVLEYCARDSDYVGFYGETPSLVIAQFHDMLRSLTAQARHEGVPLEVICRSRSDSMEELPERPW